MRVIIVGAGEVGSYVAQKLSRESIDIVVIEVDPRKLERVGRRHDVHTICGDGTHPDVLKRAGAEHADLLVAVTAKDAVNFLSCLVGKQLGVKRAIARAEADELRSGPLARQVHEACGADTVIDPDDEIARQIQELLAHPGTREVHRMVDDQVVVISAELPRGAPLCGQRLRDIGERFGPDWNFIIGTITHEGETVIPRSDVRLREGDLVRVFALARAEDEVMGLLGLQSTRLRRVMVLGGGRTGEKVSRLLRSQAEVTLIELDPERASAIAERLDGVLVLQGDITDAELLAEEDIELHDAVVATTGEDDANILACLFAKSVGVAETISLVHKLELRQLIGELGIDVALSPRTASANAVLQHVRGGLSDVTVSLENDIEYYDVVVQPGARACGVTIEELDLPKQTLIAAISRAGDTQIGRAAAVIQAEDHVVVVSRPEETSHIRRLFGAD